MLYSTVKEKIVDWWLTKRTGRNSEQRMCDKWLDENINYNANTIHEYFQNFEYVINVNAEKAFILDHPFGMPPRPEMAKYIYPNRPLDDSTLYKWCCGTEKEDGTFLLSSLRGYERVYVATNNKDDAMMIALRFS